MQENGNCSDLSELPHYYSDSHYIAPSCVNRVCLSLREHISGTARPNITEFVMNIAYICHPWLGYVLPVLWMTSYLHNEPYAEVPV